MIHILFPLRVYVEPSADLVAVVFMPRTEGGVGWGWGGVVGGAMVRTMMGDPDPDPDPMLTHSLTHSPSVPAPGSLMPIPHTLAPVHASGRYFSFCSWLPF